MAKQKKIFWAEDEQELISIYTDALGKDFSVEFFKLAQSALDKIEEIKQGKAEKPDLVVIDLLLPDMNGTAVLEELKKSSAMKDIPVFILTNYGEEQNHKNLPEELRVEKYLVKTSWPPTKLVPLIKETLK